MHDIVKRAWNEWWNALTLAIMFLSFKEKKLSISTVFKEEKLLISPVILFPLTLTILFRSFKEKKLLISTETKAVQAKNVDPPRLASPSVRVGVWALGNIVEGMLNEWCIALTLAILM